MDKDKIWDEFLDIIRSNCSDLTFNTWFKTSKLVRIEKKNNYVIMVDNKFIKDHLMEYFDSVIEDTLKEIVNSEITYDIYTVDEENEKNTENSVETTNNNDSIFIEPVKNSEVNNINSNLNPNYTFSNFVVGECNKQAQIVALSVAEKPGRMYNPLFIHGKSGIGKTHLMHAIGNYIVETSNKSVIYISSQDFMDDFTAIFRSGSDNYELKEHFQNKYRNVDVLMVDDIQMLSGASKTQDEFFATFNSLRDNGKQIIISSDRSPDDLQMLEDRLKTRFSWGLTVLIQPPDFDLKMKIVKNKMSYYNIAKEIDPKIYEYIASNSESDVRHIEGAITKLLSDTAIYNPKELTLDFAMTSLRETWNNNYYIVNSVGKIQKAVADYYNLTVENLKSKKRTAEIKNARQVAMYLCKMTTEETIEKIGLEFNRDHATVIHSCNKIEEDLRKDTELQTQIKEIKLKIAN